MRRAPGAVLLAAGTFLIVGAVAMPLLVAPALVKVPLDQSSVTVSTAENATVLDFGTLSERTGVDLTATRAVRGDVPAGNKDRSVLKVGVRVVDHAGKEITVSTDRVAMDRRTAEAVACCAEEVNGTAFKHEGLTYKFPFGTKKTTYQYFDNSARKAYPARFVGTEQLQGLNVYKFQMTVSPIKISEIKVPGTMLGSTEQVATAERYYANTRTIWVEPESGVIVRGQEEQLQTLRNTEGVDKVTIIRATLNFSEDTQKQQAKAAREAQWQITLLTLVVPLALGIIGAVLVLLGVIRAVRGSRGAALAGSDVTDDSAAASGRHRGAGADQPTASEAGHPGGPITDVLPPASRNPLGVPPVPRQERRSGSERR